MNFCRKKLIAKMKSREIKAWNMVSYSLAKPQEYVI